MMSTPNDMFDLDLTANSNGRTYNKMSKKSYYGTMQLYVSQVSLHLPTKVPIPNWRETCGEEEILVVVANFPLVLVDLKF